MTGPTHPEPGRMTRRTVVQSGTAITAFAVLGSATRVVSPALAAVSRTHLRRASYTSLVGSEFMVTGAGGVTVPLRLAQVADLARAAAEPAYAGHDDVFSLLFTGPRATVLLQGLHTLQHPSLGTFSLFVVPVGGGSGDQLYEVVVDRSVPVAEAAETAPEPLAQSNEPDRPADSAPAAGPAAPPPAASDPVPVTAADGTRATPFPSGDAPEGKPTKKRATPRKVLRATAARRGGVLSADVRVARGQGIVAVRTTLLRGDRVLATGSRRLKGRFGVRVPLSTRRTAPRGDLTLRVTTTDRRGRRATTRWRVTL